VARFFWIENFSDPEETFQIGFLIEEGEKTGLAHEETLPPFSQSMTFTKYTPIALCFFAVVCCKKNDDSEPKDSSSESKQDQSSNQTLQTEAMSEADVDQLKSQPLKTQEDYFEYQNSLQFLSDSQVLQFVEELFPVRHRSTEESAAFGMVMGELAKRNPTEVLEYFSPKELTTTEVGLSDVMSVLASERPDILKDWLIKDLRNADYGAEKRYLEFGLSYLAQNNPSEAVAVLLEIDKERMDYNVVIQDMFAKYGSESPTSALAAAEQSFEGKERDTAIYAIALGMNDHEAVIEMSEKIVSDDLRGTALMIAFSELANEDLENAKQRLKELNDTDLQSIVANSAFRPDSVITSLAKDDPELLVGLLQRVSVSSYTQQSFEKAARMLGEQDPVLAQKLISSVPKGPLQLGMIGSQYERMARDDTAAAVRQAATLEDQDMKNEAYRRIGEVTGRLGVEETLKVAQDLAGEDKTAFLQTALGNAVGKDPEAVAELAIANEIDLPPSEASGLLEAAAATIANQDQEKAWDWYGQLPVEKQPAAMRGLARDMARRDVVGLGDMLSEMPQNDAWQQGVGVLIESIQNTDPERAAQWQEQLDASREDEPEE
jgi:hypothetical protein